MRRTNAIMKPGRVIYIRVNPKDCMSCIDVVKKTGMNLQGASFSLIASAALSSALESFRQNGIIPDRDGFEYADMMREYPMSDKQGRAKALAITRTFSLAGSNIVVPPAVPRAPVDQRKKSRFDELAFKANHDEANMDEVERVELQELIQELMPL